MNPANFGEVAIERTALVIILKRASPPASWRRAASAARCPVSKRLRSKVISGGNVSQVVVRAHQGMI